MKNKLVAPSNALARRLVDHGCPLDTLNVVDDGYESAHRRLVIEQQDYIHENRIFETRAGTGLKIPLRIGYGAREKLTICDWDLDLPGMKTQVIWLEDPHEMTPAMDLYRIPGASQEEFCRDEVMNHHRILTNGALFEGFLLGCWFERIPKIYTHGITVNTTLILINQIGRCFSTQVELRIDRKSRRSPRRREGPPRQRIFDEQDMLTLEEAEGLETRC